MLKKLPSDKINGKKNIHFFLSRASAHHSLTFNLRSLYEPKHEVRLSKTVCGISLKLCVGFSIFDFVSFLLKFIFLFNKKHELFDFKTS